MGAPFEFIMPENMSNFLCKYNGTSIEVSFNGTDVLNGYGQALWITVRVSMLNKRCNRCDYQSLWNPYPEKRCRYKHTYEAERYDDVFVWRNVCELACSDSKRDINNGALTSLEEAFNIFLKNQPKWLDGPIKAMYFDAHKKYSEERAKIGIERCSDCGYGAMSEKYNFCPKCGVSLRKPIPFEIAI